MFLPFSALVSLHKGKGANIATNTFFWCRRMFLEQTAVMLTWRLVRSVLNLDLKLSCKEAITSLKEGGASYCKL